jgi:MYXO-CTERM domain-containing protein
VLPGNAAVAPEPSSIMLALMGLFGLVAYGWRRRNGEQSRTGIKLR